MPAIAISDVCFGMELEIYENDSKINGAIFCHVDKMKQFIQDNEVITDGNHR